MRFYKTRNNICVYDILNEKEIKDVSLADLGKNDICIIFNEDELGNIVPEISLGALFWAGKNLDSLEDLHKKYKKAKLVWTLLGPEITEAFFRAEEDAYNRIKRSILNHDEKETQLQKLREYKATDEYYYSVLERIHRRN